MQRFLTRALAAAAMVALALLSTTAVVGATPVLDAEVDADALVPVPGPVDAEVEATVDPTAGTSVCVDVAVAGNGTATCAPSGGLPLPVPLPGPGGGGLPGADALGPAAICLTAPELCVAQATAPLAGVTDGLPTGGLPMPLPPMGGLGLPGPGAGGASLDACVSVGVAAAAAGCDRATVARAVTDSGAAGDGSGGTGGGAALAFTGGPAGLLGGIGSALVVAGAVARRLARARV